MLSCSQGSCLQDLQSWRGEDPGLCTFSRLFGKTRCHPGASSRSNATGNKTVSMEAVKISSRCVPGSRAEPAAYLSRCTLLINNEFAREEETSDLAAQEAGFQCFWRTGVVIKN